MPPFVVADIRGEILGVAFVNLAVVLEWLKRVWNRKNQGNLGEGQGDGVVNALALK
jgi:hypothetical protein